MKLWGHYLREHTRHILIFFLFSCIFILTFALYSLPLDAVLYPVAICSVLALVFFMIGFHFYRIRHIQIQELAHRANVSLAPLHHPKTLLEKEYQDILISLFQEKKTIESQMQNRYTDLIEYYTVWAHQIKTPIASMHLSLQEDDSAFSRELTEGLREIEQYVEMVLCYLRLDSAATDYMIQKLDLDLIIRQAVRKFASQFIRRKIKLEYESCNFTVLTDEKWLLFVLEQVISNAIKYSRDGGTVFIRMNDPGILSIGDSGIGIAPEDLPRIFEKGYTGYNGHSDKKASGIGLYLCRRICTNLRHRITAKSALGRGTVIFLDLNRTELDFE
ncbi:sensor histidine kinase [Clostridium merdae]|uniref:sensor histidine kinase n=1 Tax=Clostridium merdae TaxID=1958780 RepID=UPI000A26B603|nr:sensor histidine kinase [Clostridium merdae]